MLFYSDPLPPGRFRKERGIERSSGYSRHRGQRGSVGESPAHPFFITLVLGHTTANQALHAAAIVKLADVSFVSTVEGIALPSHWSSRRLSDSNAGAGRAPSPQSRPRASPAAPRLPRHASRATPACSELRSAWEPLLDSPHPSPPAHPERRRISRLLALPDDLLFPDCQR